MADHQPITNPTSTLNPYTVGICISSAVSGLAKANPLFLTIHYDIKNGATVLAELACPLKIQNC